MTPTHTRRKQKLYRYYVDQALLKGGQATSPAARVPAATVEGAVIDQLRQLLRSPEIVIGTWKALKAEGEVVTETEVRDAIHGFDALWDELFPAEQARIVQLLVEKVRVGDDGLAITLRTDGLTRLWREVGGPAEREAA
ncbi:MAG: hypothetical protein RLO50_03640 [Azospirillaceae bacterium]